MYVFIGIYSGIDPCILGNYAGVLVLVCVCVRRCRSNIRGSQCQEASRWPTSTPHRKIPERKQKEANKLARIAGSSKASKDLRRQQEWLQALPAKPQGPLTQKRHVKTQPQFLALKHNCPQLTKFRVWVFAARPGNISYLPSILGELRPNLRHYIRII